MDNTDPISMLKAQIGELLWNQAVLVAENNKLKKQLNEKPNESSAS